MLHLAHLATNALFILQMHIENAEKSSKTPPDFYTYKKPPQNHKKNKAPEITGTFFMPNYETLKDSKTGTSLAPEYTQVGDYEFLKEYEKQAIWQRQDAFELPEHRGRIQTGLLPQDCIETL